MHVMPGDAETPDVRAGLHEFGGRPCVALANTVIWRRGEHRELLTGYDALLRWALHTGSVAPEIAETLAGLAEDRPRAAADALGRALEVRELLYRVFAAVAAGEPIGAADLDDLNAAIAGALGHAALEPAAAGGFVLGWQRPEAHLGAPLWAPLRSAAEVLSGPDLARVKQCPGPTCGWLFVDDTRSGTRRWCEPHLCGARERARTHYARRRTPS
jgi:predicted RNA-binding Zn ribbon-like protein